VTTRPLLITRSPLRISLGGGGTDLPSYYEEHSGFLVAAAIDRYVYITIHHRFVPRLLLKYSQMEEVESIDEIRHPLIREALKLVKGDWAGLEITSMADIPAGTGLGSSGSFTTALLKALHTLSQNLVHPNDLAEQACRIEIDILKEPVGKQDQYIAAYGGITSFRFLPNQQVEAWPLKISPETLYELEDHLLLFFTGYTRSASEILREQDSRSRVHDREMIANLHFIKQIGRETKEALEAGDLQRFGDLMNIHWEHKQQRSSQMSNAQINHWHNLARSNGAIGGKLIGAGGGGFLMFFAPERARLKKVLQEEGLQEVRFRFDFEGTKVVIQ
jgi:D-glycero-alpha-D-manno-heptose-7-phosphate kinase